MQTVPTDGLNGLMTGDAAPNLLPQDHQYRRGENTRNRDIGADNGLFSRRSPVPEKSYRYELDVRYDLDRTIRVVLFTLLTCI